jgi:rare lipoprotein A (peptidoglycan hydrolase)
MSTNPIPKKSYRSYSNINKVVYSSSRFRAKESKNYRSESYKNSRQAESEKKYLDEDFESYGLDNVEESEDQNNGKNLGEQISGYYKVGQPYEIQGVSYIPEEYEEFEETGIASWYGSEFDGKMTANGEIFDLNVVSAAHPTLPLPSLVRVTNLSNNKSIIVRVNDRGPFVGDRIIDLSEKGAEILGFKEQGKTEVKIQLLRNETDKMLFDIGYIKAQ